MSDCVFCKIVSGEIRPTRYTRTMISSASGIWIRRLRCMC